MDEEFARARFSGKTKDEAKKLMGTSNNSRQFVKSRFVDLIDDRRFRQTRVCRVIRSPLFLAGAALIFVPTSCRRGDVTLTRANAGQAWHSFSSEDTKGQKTINLLGVSARQDGPSALSVTLTNGNNSALALYTAGVRIRGFAPRSYVTNEGRKIEVSIPNEIILPAGGSHTFPIALPDSENAKGGTLHCFFIAVFHQNRNRVYEGDFELRADVK